MSPPADSDRNKPKTKGKCSCNPAFFGSVEGVLKIIEFFTTLIAWIICAIGYSKTDTEIISRYGFYLFIGISAWVFTIIVILFHLCGLYNKWISYKLSRLYSWFIHLLAYSAIYMFFFLAGSILICFQYSHWSGNAAAAFFGFVNLILFTIDTILYFRVCRKYRIEIRRIHRGEYYKDPDMV